jgi:hypothetical protein
MLQRNIAVHDTNAIGIHEFGHQGRHRFHVEGTAARASEIAVELKRDQGALGTSLFVVLDGLRPSGRRPYEGWDKE